MLCWLHYPKNLRILTCESRCQNGIKHAWILLGAIPVGKDKTRQRGWESCRKGDSGLIPNERKRMRKRLVSVSSLTWPGSSAKASGSSQAKGSQSLEKPVPSSERLFLAHAAIGWEQRWGRGFQVDLTE